MMTPAKAEPTRENQEVLVVLVMTSGIDFPPEKWCAIYRDQCAIRTALYHRIPGDQKGPERSRAGRPGSRAGSPGPRPV